MPPLFEQKPTTMDNCSPRLLLLLFTFICASVSMAFSQNTHLRFDHLNVESGLSQNSVEGIVKDKYGFMWFSTYQGLCRWDGYKFKVYRADPSNPKALKNRRVQLLYKDSAGDIWAGSPDTLVCRYNYLTDDFTRFSKTKAPGQIVYSLDRMRSTHFNYIETSNTIWRVNQSCNALMGELPSNRIKFLYQLTQQDKATGQYVIYNTNYFNKWAINDETVFCIYLDDNEMFWAGTYCGGVNKADSRQKPFRYYFHNGLPNSIINNKIRALCVDQSGYLWVGTNNHGITRIDREKNKYVHFQRFINSGNKNTLIHNEIRKIYNDRYGFIWIGTRGGLDRYDPQTGIFHHYPFPSRLPHNRVYDIMEDRKGNLWLGTWNGIARYDRKKDTFKVFKHEDLLKSYKVRAVLSDEHNDFWVATESGGLTYLKYENQGTIQEKFTPTHFLHSENDSNTICSNCIFTMIRDKNGTLWIGTDSGVDRFDPETGIFKHIGLDEGLPNEFITGLVCDLNDNIWISHKEGLTRLDPQTLKMQTFTESDGLQSKEFSENACFLDPKTGEMFFGGVNGFNSFFPDQLKINPYKPVIYITEMQVALKPVGINEEVNGRIILDKPLYLTDEIKLNHRDKTVSFEFVGLHYSDPAENQYAYMLEGYDKNWIFTNASKRQASYYDLMPGTYYFKVKASNNDGIWNDEPVILKVIVLNPWWRTWWFRIAVVISVIGFFWFLNYYRESRYKRKQEALQALVDQRTLELQVLNSTKDRFFSIIAHDLRNPFHVVTGFSEILQRDFQKLPGPKIEKFLSLIITSAKNGSNLLENLLQWSRSQTGRIPFEPLPINLFVIIEEIFNFFDCDIQKKNLQTQINIEPNLTVMADENMLRTILRNLISNAIKFSNEQGTIAVSAKISAPFVEIKVSDTGVGIPPERLPLLFNVDSNITTKGTSQEPGSGLGLIICKEFVEKHNGKIWAESQSNVATSFIFTLPMA